MDASSILDHELDRVRSSTTCRHRQLDGSDPDVWNFDADLIISLIGPDGTTVLLSNRRGGSADNFGTSCSIYYVFGVFK